MMKKSLILLFLTVFCSVLPAAVPRFRSGTVRRVEVRTRAQLSALLLPEGEQFAELTVLLDPGRSLSMNDFALMVYPSGKKTYCLYLASGEAPWDPALRMISADTKERTVRMLFSLPDGTRSVELKFLLFETGEQYRTIRLSASGKVVFQ